jgi:four helix bundle protein
MLRIYDDAIAMCADAATVAKAIERFDGDLARQLRRAASSVALNISEGSGAFGGNRRQRYFSAMGSAREVLACFDVAEAMRYVAPVDAIVRRRLDVIVGTLVRVLGLSRRAG